MKGVGIVLSFMPKNPFTDDRDKDVPTTNHAIPKMLSDDDTSLTGAWEHLIPKADKEIEIFLKSLQEAKTMEGLLVEFQKVMREAAIEMHKEIEAEKNRLMEEMTNDKE